MKALRRFLGLIIFVTTPVLVLAEDDSEELDHVDLATQQVRQGLNIAGGAKAAITEFFHEHKRMPSDNYEAGLTDSFNIRSDVVSAVVVLDGEIRVTFGGEAVAEISGRVVELVPFASGGRIRWQCRASYIDDRYLPDACRRSNAQLD